MNAADAALPAAPRRAALRALGEADANLAENTCEGLLQLVGQVPPELERDLAGALGRCPSEAVQRKLVAIAGDRNQNASRRRTAIMALGYRRTKDAASALMRLLDASANDPQRATIFEALAQLSGLTSLGQDVPGWRAWWREHRNLNDQRWSEHLLANHSRRAEVAETAQPIIREQLLEAQRQLYRAVPESDRAALLATMLSDPNALPETRAMALDLALKMLTDNQQVGPELRRALIGRLDDPQEEIRKRAALLLRDLADEGAADAVAERLLTERETSVSVLRAYLRVLARVPRAICLDTVMEFLDDPNLRGDAAAAVAAAADARLITLEQASKSAATVRAQIEADGGPVPQFVELLGKVGNDDDWARIESWLSHEDPAIKMAAASAWAASDRPLAKLAQRVADPVVQPIVIAAATKRGNQFRTMLALIEHRPEQEQMLAAWQRALLNIAGRLEPQRVLALQDALQKHQVPLPLCDQIYSAAIRRMIDTNSNGAGEPRPGAADTPPDIYAVAFVPSDQTLTELLIVRGHLRLDMGSPAQALSDFDRVALIGRNLDAATRQRVQLGTLEARLAMGELDLATEDAARILNDARREDNLPVARQAVLELFIAAANRALAANQLERAGALVQRIRSLIKAPEINEADLWRQVLEVESLAVPAPDTGAEPPAAPRSNPEPEAEPVAADID